MNEAARSTLGGVLIPLNLRRLELFWRKMAQVLLFALQLPACSSKN